MTVLPQRSFNSYDFQTTDLLGTSGQWQPGAKQCAHRLDASESRASGDFMAHFAGHGNAQQKLELVRKYLALVTGKNVTA